MTAPERHGQRMRMFYEVVTGNGSGVLSREIDTLNEAKRRAAYIAESSPIFGPVELQQVIVLPSGGRRYWMREGSKWVLWDARRDIDARQPDWRWPDVR